MKTIITICMLFLTFGCKNALEENPAYTLNENTLFATEQSAQLSLNACYAWMSHQFTYGQGLFNLTEQASGIVYFRKAPGESYQFSLQQDFQANGQFTEFAWTGLYRAISQQNIFIEVMQKSNFQNKNYMIAQAKFLRGLAYYNLAFLWGGVPLRINVPTADDTNLKRSSFEETINQAIKDLTEAEIDLRNTETDLTKPTKTAVNGLLAKIHFYLASKEGVNSENWNKAKTYGDKVLMPFAGIPPLEESFSVLFDDDHKDSKETIFKFAYSTAGTGRGFNKNSWTFSPPNSTFGQNFGGVRIQKAFFNHFKAQHPNDPRLNAFFFHTTYLNPNSNKQIPAYPTIKIGVNAGIWSKKTFFLNQVAANGYKDLVILRYADILLLMADVENELGNKSTAISYVNQVLKRARNSVSPAATSPIDVTEAISVDNLRKFIFDERLFELNFEGFTFFETRRRGLEYLKRAAQIHNNDPDTKATFSSSDIWADYPQPESEDALKKILLLPLPTTEINTNLEIGQSNQNPGY